MAAPGGQEKHNSNRLLALLPQADYKRLEPHLERVALPIRQVLYEANEPIIHVYFPLSGVTSIVATMEDGRAAEVGTIGNEGMVGIPVFLGAERTPTLAFAQVAGEAQRLRVEVFKEEVKNGGALTHVLHRYTQALFTQIAQSAACNRLHTIEQRCARWLLMTQDRVGTDEFPLTHEFLGQMLGVRRATVTEVAGTLQQAGLITYSRGTSRYWIARGWKRSRVSAIGSFERILIACWADSGGCCWSKGGFS